MSLLDQYDWHTLAKQHVSLIDVFSLPLNICHHLSRLAAYESKASACPGRKSRTFIMQTLASPYLRALSHVTGMVLQGVVVS